MCPGIHDLGERVSGRDGSRPWRHGPVVSPMRTPATWSPSTSTRTGSSTVHTRPTTKGTGSNNRGRGVQRSSITLKREHASYDALVFFTYLYAPTVLGLEVDPRRSILVPTAHDEPAIRLGLYRQLFSLPAGIAFNTTMERGFLRRLFEIEAKVQEVVGCGVDLPPQL